MNKRYMAAHWGTYEVTGFGEKLRLHPVKDDPNPSSIGAGWVSALRDTKARISGPHVRRGWLENRDTSRCSGESFVPVSWDAALDLVAEELQRIRSEYGNDALFAGSYGWASAGRFHHAQSQLRRFLNTIGGFTRSVDTYSHAAAEVLLPHITGLSHRQFQDQLTSWSLIADHCECLIAFGGVSGRTAQITASGTSVHEVESWLSRAADNGVKTFVISPQRGDFVDHIAAEWVPIRPGTDTALMLAIAHELIRTGAVDRSFLDRYTMGWQILESYISGSADGVAKSAEWAAEICDVPPAMVRRLAGLMAERKTMITASWGLQRSDHGEQPLWMGLALAAMLGQIGKPGTGFGYGSITAAGRPAKLIPWPSLPQGINPVADFIPVARIADMLEQPRGTFAYNGARHRYPDARLVYWAGGNPFHHHQDLNRLERLWQRPETVIVHDHSWTATAHRADIILPTTSPLERDDIMVNRRDTALIWMSRAMDRIGDCRDDFEIFSSLAERLGTGEEFTEGRSTSQWLAWIWEGCARVANKQGFDLPSFAAFQMAGRFNCPDTVETRTLFGEFVNDPESNALATVSGKIELFSSTLADMNLADIDGHPHWYGQDRLSSSSEPRMLHLISPQPAARLHAQLDNGSASRDSKVSGREPCFLHPDAAAERGICNGDVVLLENDRGACLAGAVLTDGIRADTVALATGSFLDFRKINGRRIEINGNPNVLTSDKGCSELSQGNTAHTARVIVSKFAGTAPQPTTLHVPPINRVQQNFNRTGGS